MTKAVVMGMLIGGVGGPVLLACFGIVASMEGRALAPFIGQLLFFMFLVGPAAAVAGGAMGSCLQRQLQRGVATVHLFLYAAGRGACLRVVVLGASVGFLYSFGAIANWLSVLAWLAAFGPIVAALLPQGMLIGTVCGILIAFAIYRGSS